MLVRLPAKSFVSMQTNQIQQTNSFPRLAPMGRCVKNKNLEKSFTIVSNRFSKVHQTLLATRMEPTINPISTNRANCCLTLLKLARQQPRRQVFHCAHQANHRLSKSILTIRQLQQLQRMRQLNLISKVRPPQLRCAIGEVSVTWTTIKVLH